MEVEVKNEIEKKEFILTKPCITTNLNAIGDNGNNIKIVGKIIKKCIN